LLVLAHLQRRWSLSSRDGFGTLSSEVLFTVFSAPYAGFGSTRRWLREHRTLVLRASDAGCVSGEYTVLQPRWNQALDAPVLLHRSLKWYCSCSSGNVTSAASSNPRVDRTQWRPLAHRQTRPVSENHLWLLTRVHRTLGIRH
jgi:hypothetical protein